MAEAPEKTSGLTVNQLVALSQTLSRLQFVGQLGLTFSGDRDMYSVLGYPRDLTFSHYYSRYTRGGIAARIIDAPCDAVWQKSPEVYEDTGEDTETAFEKAWKELETQVKIFHYLNRVDKLSGIGRYGVLLIGVKGGDALDTPLRPGSLKSPEDILYLAAYSESNAGIHSYTTNSQDANFGKPEFYTINLAGNIDGFALAGASPQQKVHYSRVLHVAENRLEDEVFGLPRLQRVYNYLEDLDKVVGGSAEMYWQGARRTPVMEIDKEASVPDASQIEQQLDDLVHHLRSSIWVQGGTLKTLPSVTPDPTGNVDVIVSMISATKGIPRRILMGSEQGELASSQDEKNWNRQTQIRMVNYAEPQILRPYIEKLLLLGALPQPVKPILVEWPDLFALDAQETVAVNERKVNMLAKYAATIGAEQIVPPMEFREEFLELDPEPPVEAMADLEERELDEADEEVQKQFAQGGEIEETEEQEAA